MRKLKQNHTLGMITAICFLAGISGLPFNAMPVFIGSAADAFSLTPQQMGGLGSFLLSGWVMGGILCSWKLHNVSWKTATTIGTLIAIISTGISQLSPSLAHLYLCWFGFGLGASIPTCVAYEALSQMDNKERAFGLLTASAISVAAVVLYIFPVWIEPNWQYQGTAVSLALLMSLMLLAVKSIPTDKHVSDQSIPYTVITESANIPAWIGLFAFIIFFAGQAGLWAFLERMGRDIGATPNEIGTTLSLLKGVGALASLMVVVLASRLGTRWPHIFCFIGIVASVIILDNTSTLISYAGGSWLWELCFTLGYCYCTAMISRLDRTGRVVVLIPASIGLAGAIGPGLAGYLKTSATYQPIYTMAIVGIFFSMVIFLILHRYVGDDATTDEMSFNENTLEPEISTT